MTSDITDLMEDFLKSAYPVRKMKVPNKALQRHALPHKRKFKKVILINSNNIFRVSDKYNEICCTWYIYLRTM